eukprot:3230518-Rhodomonas_salina.1
MSPVIRNTQNVVPFFCTSNKPRFEICTGGLGPGYPAIVNRTLDADSGLFSAVLCQQQKAHENNAPRRKKLTPLESNRISCPQHGIAGLGLERGGTPKACTRVKSRGGGGPVRSRSWEEGSYAFRVPRTQLSRRTSVLPAPAPRGRISLALPPQPKSLRRVWDSQCGRDRETQLSELSSRSTP